MDDGFQVLVGLAEIHVPRMWVETDPDDSDSQVCNLPKKLQSWIKRVPSMIRIYRHSERIGVTCNRGKRDREHMPEFCIFSLF